MNEDQTLRLQQDLEFNLALLNDQIREIQQDRTRIRQQIQQNLSRSIPQNLENLLTREQKGLLRLSKLPYAKLSDQERTLVNTISQKLERLANGGCYNLSLQQETELRSQNRLFSFTIPGLPVHLCFDILTPLQSGLLNTNLDMVDIIIYGAQGESYRYPLDEETSKRYLNRVRELGGDPALYARMRFPQIEQTTEQIQFINLQLNPNIIQ